MDDSWADSPILHALGTHFDCGDVITVTITATNNQVKLDEEGSPVTDEFGNPQINYNLGDGFVTVASGGR